MPVSKEAAGYVFIGMLVYIFPSFVADIRSHRQRYAILALNLLLGWTVLGWIIALIWSLTYSDRNGR
jgi:Superinfection immunity protein